MTGWLAYQAGVLRRGTARIGLSRLIVFACVLALLASGVFWWISQTSGTRITAYFDKAVGLYQGSSVRVLGVKVGTIDAVQPQGDVVRVDMRVDDNVRIPAGAKAVVVAPSLVSDRYVQLTPAYSGGPPMRSGTSIPKQSTMTPAELDDLYRNANALSQALGPQGVNSDGALTDMLNATAANLRGNGTQLNSTLHNLGDLAATLSDNKTDLFSTVDNLNKFTETLAQSDSQIRDFYGRIADVTGFVASERDQLGASVGALAGALTELNGFIKNNQQAVSSNVHNLTAVTQALVNQRNAVAEFLDVGPTGAANFINAYDAASGSVAVRGQLNELTLPPILMACHLVLHAAPQQVPPALTQACQQFEPILDGRVKLPSVGQALASMQQGQLPPMPLPIADMVKRSEMPGPAGGGR